MPRLKARPDDSPDMLPNHYGIPDREWADLLHRANAFERRVSDLVGATNLIADEWARKVVSPPPKIRKIDTAGRAALEAFQIGFEQLAQSRSHGAMRDILGRISPHWRDGDFHIPGVDEHEIVWPGTLAFEISEFLDQRPEGRPRKDAGPNQVAAESLIEAWVRHLRKPANMKYGPGSTLWFFEGLLMHIQPNVDIPRPAPTRPRRKAVVSSTRTAGGDEVLPSASLVQLPNFSAELIPALKRALKREQAMHRNPRKRSGTSGNKLDVTAPDIVE